MDHCKSRVLGIHNPGGGGGRKHEQEGFCVSTRSKSEVHRYKRRSGERLGGDEAVPL